MESTYSDRNHPSRKDRVEALRKLLDVDSPLGLAITRIYANMQEFWDKEVKDLLANGDHPFDFKRLYAVGKYEDHKKLLDIKGSAIIIAGSGMCAGGRIVDWVHAMP